MGGHAAPASTGRAHRYAIIGNGAIATELRSLARAHPALDLVGIVTRPGSAAPAGAAALTLAEAIDRADTVVEAAGVAAVAEHGPAVIQAGRTLLVSSVGAFAHAEHRAGVLDAGPGRALITSGAIGGLDLIAAAGRTGGLDRVTLTTTKHPRSLVQPGMPEPERARILGATQATELFSGSVEDAIARFPASLNVAVALGLAAGDLGLVRVRLSADPAATQTEHRIEAVGAAGSYRFLVRNEPLPEHPSSSGLTARSLLSELLRLAGQGTMLA
ncbi:aspartate dehydrogenase domain-containing protein [Leucobacter sp. M11]|uniref:aspartate dehydrogenase domain-containing protein n=1 Tax=Leucobacter sp. M11 TaxID=2993565 RepID=UPI002D7ED673|nr:aspartate dehydrogenase domain-containing protein [Leucobacter sp. M11]MEB4613090.1 DUF108 domain-containing protein [Leucobacter sp. M11]